MADQNKNKTLLKEYTNQLEELLKSREQSDRKIQALAKTIEGLKLLAREDDGLDFSESEMIELSGKLADAVRTILRNAGGAPMTPVGIKVHLEDVGFELGRYPNPLAAIHAILKRMAESDSGEFKAEVVPSGKTVYRWIGELERAVDRLISNSHIRPEVKGSLIAAMIEQDRQKKK